MFAINNCKYTIVITNNSNYTMINFFIEINFGRDAASRSYDECVLVNAKVKPLLDYVEFCIEDAHGIYMSDTHQINWVVDTV